MLFLEKIKFLHVHYHIQDMRTRKSTISICVENDAPYQKSSPGMDEFKPNVFISADKFS